MLRAIALLAALASTFAATSARADWIVSGRLVEARIAACTQTFVNACDLTSPNFPASIDGRLVEFVNVSCSVQTNAAVPSARLKPTGSARYQDLQPVTQTGTSYQSYNSQASLTIQAATSRAMTLRLGSDGVVAITANCLLVGRLVD